MATSEPSDQASASIVKEFANLLRALPKGLKPWLGLAGVLFGGALAWLVIASGKQPGPVAVVPALSLFGLSFVTVLYTLARLRKATTGVTQTIAEEFTSGVSEALAEEIVDGVVLQVSDDLREGYTRFPPEGRLIGLWFGRHSVACGALTVSGARTARLPGPRSYKELDRVIERPFDGESPEGRFAIAAEIIKEVVSGMRDLDRSLRIEGIGIGAPGFHNLTEKLIAKSVVGMPSGTHLIDELASRLARDAAITERLGRSDPADIADICYIDNDVRCAARRALSQHREDAGWDNYACLYIGSGVSVGLVMDRTLYYGPHFWSGEIGHIDLGVDAASALVIGDDLRADRSRAAAGGSGRRTKGSLPPQVCTCGHKGYHFESLVNYRGLAALAECVDSERYDAIVETLRGVDASWDDEKIRRRGWPVLIATTGRNAPLPPQVRELVEPPAYETYLGRVRDVYTALVSGGISTIVSLLDIEKFVLLGSLVETLHSVSNFEEKLQRALALRLQPPRAIDFQVRIAAEDIWQGAALLARDRDYLRVRDATHHSSYDEP